MRLAPSLAALVLLSGCHSRFKKAAPTIDHVRVEAVVLNGPSVVLPTVGGGSAVAAVVAITQSVRAGNIAGHIRRSVDPNAVNQAFVDGFARTLTAPPFDYDDNADHVLQYELVNWGLQIPSVVSGGVFTYELTVRGYRPNGKKFYRSSVQCITDAGLSGWAEMTPFGDNNPDRIKNMPPETIQAIFDATAADCAQQAVFLLRRHAD